MYNRGNYKPPKKIVTWKEGAACGICGQQILEKHLSRDAFKNDYEKKWCVHWACKEKMSGHLDRLSR